MLINKNTSIALIVLLTLCVACDRKHDQNKTFPTVNVCVDCSHDSILSLLTGARTPADTLFAVMADIDNLGGPPIGLEQKIKRINELIQLNDRLNLIDIGPYEIYRDGMQLWVQNEQNKSIDKIELAIEEFDRQKKIMGDLSILNGLRLYYSTAGLKKEREVYYTNKLKYYHANGPVENTATCYHAIAGTYTYNADYDNAISHYLKAAEIYKPYSPGGYANEINAIGRYYYKWGNFDRAIYYIDTAVKLSLDLNLRERVAESKIMLSIIYKNRKEYATSMNNIDEAIALSDTIGSNQIKAICLAEKAGILLEINNPTQAIIYLHESRRIRDSLSYPLVTNNGELEVNYYFYKYFRQLNNISDADAELEKALRIAQLIKDDRLTQKYKKELSSFYYETGKKIKSADIALNYIAFGDSLQYVFNSKNIAAYENEQKEIRRSLEVQRLKNQKETQKVYFIIGGIFLLLFSIGIFSRLQFARKVRKQLIQKNIVIAKEKDEAEKQRERSDELLLNILPEEVAEELKAKGSADAKQFDDATVMFTDFKGFTQISEKLTPSELVAEIHSCFKAFDNIITKHNIEKIKTIGDAYMCAGGLPVANTTNATDVVNAAMEIQMFMLEHLQQRKNEGKEVFEIRIGIHTGPVVAGIVGVKKFAYDIWGDTVNIASRMESSGEAGKVNISGSTYELIKDKFNCIHRGKIQAKNKGEIDMYFVEAVS